MGGAPLSPALSPFVPHGARETETRAGRAPVSSPRRWGVRTVGRRAGDRRALPHPPLRLPRPVRHERGEGWGEGCLALANGRTSAERLLSPALSSIPNGGEGAGGARRLRRFSGGR